MISLFDYENLISMFDKIDMILPISYIDSRACIVQQLAWHP